MRNEDEMEALLKEFASPEKIVSAMDECRRDSLKTVRIVTGRGTHSPQMKGVLPEAAGRQLSQLKKAERVFWYTSRVIIQIASILLAICI